MNEKTRATGERVVVGMSGGVDSSITALLLKQHGWRPIGVTLSLDSWRGGSLKENVCCTAESRAIARRVCSKLGIPYHVVNAKRAFRSRVINYFLRELRAGRTPNPCVVCNRFLKFAELFEFAEKKGIRFAATGHYAKITKKKNGRAKLSRGVDELKDQSYGLCLLPQEWLKKIVLPLGDYTKSEVYEIARREGFEFFLKTRQSQDTCFVSGADVKRFLQAKLGKREGAIIDERGKKIGVHYGVHFHTVGQRRGLGNDFADACFIEEIDAARNELRVTRDRTRLRRKTVFVSQLNFFGAAPKRKTRVFAKIRYRQKPQKATLFPSNNGVAKLVFDEGVEAVPRGQVAAFYVGKECLGGGIISRVE